MQTCHLLPLRYTFHLVVFIYHYVCPLYLPCISSQSLHSLSLSNLRFEYWTPTVSQNRSWLSFSNLNFFFVCKTNKTSHRVRAHSCNFLSLNINSTESISLSTFDFNSQFDCYPPQDDKVWDWIGCLPFYGRVFAALMQIDWPCQF